MSRQEDFDKYAVKTAETISHQWGTEGLTYADLVSAGNECAEYGYQYARKNLWFDAQGDNVPEYGREVIVIGRDGKIFYGHRPDPKEVTMVEGKPYHAKTYDKNGWNWPDIALWLDVEVPHEMVDKIVTVYFKENEQKRDSE